MKVYPVMKVALGDEEYVWDRNEMLGSEWMMIQNELGGMKWEPWLDSIDARDFPACQVLIWFLRYKNGQQQDRFSVDFPLFQLALSVVDDEVVDGPEAGAGSEPATPEPSPTTSGSDPGNGPGLPGLTSVA